MTDFVDLNVKSGNQERICSPVGFSEELVEVFDFKKDLKLEPRMTKKLKFSSFQSFYAIFVKISTDFVNWTVENGHQSINVLSSSVL